MAALHDEVFRVLGVGREADAATVKQAYRALARRYHPDANPGDDGAAARFREVNLAYEAWLQAREPAPSPSMGQEGAAAPDPEQVFTQFGDLFADFFGGRSGPSTPQRGADLLQVLQVTRSEARDGAERQLPVVRRTLCSACEGTGARDSVTTGCPECQGKGKKAATHGFLVIETVCAACRGAGRAAAVRCARCEQGLSETSETLRVTVPAGATTDLRLRCAGKGNEAPGGQPGDLYLQIEIVPDVLVRRGDDVVVEAVLEAAHVLRGGTIEVPALEGRVRVPVAPGVRDGDTFTLAGRGYPRSATGHGIGPTTAAVDPYRDVARGDQVVVFRVAAARARLRQQIVWLGVGLAASAAVIWTALALGR